MTDPITSLPEAVAALGALPVPVGDQPQPLDGTRLAQDLAAYAGHPDLGFACCTAHAVADHVPALLAEVKHLRGQQAKDDTDYEKATAELAAARARIAELETDEDRPGMRHAIRITNPAEEATR